MTHNQKAVADWEKKNVRIFQRRIDLVSQWKKQHNGQTFPMELDMDTYVGDYRFHKNRPSDRQMVQMMTIKYENSARCNRNRRAANAIHGN